MKSITQEIAELRAMDVAALAARHEVLFGRAPRVRHREFLWKRCAWKLQEQRFGGLSKVAQRRLDELISEIDLPVNESVRTVVGKLRARRRPGGPSLGTTIVRVWHGREIRVNVVDGGFEHEGVLHRSLSAVAKTVTGTHWNGRLFFGLPAGPK